MTYQIGIYDHATSEYVTRDMTVEEIESYEASLAASNARKQAEMEANAKRDNILTALAEAAGLEIDEVKAVLG